MLLAASASLTAAALPTASGGSRAVAANPSPTLQLYALEAELAAARARVAAVDADRERLAAEQASARRALRAAEATLHGSRASLARLVRTLYVSAEADPIAIVLGAGSLDEAMTGLDSLQRSARQSRAICAQARAARAEVRARANALAAHERRLDSLAAAARDDAAALSATVDRRRAFVAELRRREGAARAAATEGQARAAQVVSETLSTTAAPSAVRVVEATGTEMPAVRGVHTLTVDAVAYSLPGRTANGLPVGHGVVAVDPAVIPLGTRMIVPGYGTAIAADVGSAVRGLVIDLWFPTLAEAQAWGRRTVTITLF